ncbi:MAG: hypothetical protein KA795_07900 [Burkholderiaceae bacterium]|nr:hypothetical protein [Burkholderiaceae bacterium]
MLQLAVLLCALVVAPWLGQLHRVLHAAPTGGVVAAAAPAFAPSYALPETAGAPAHHGHAHGGLADLFGDHLTGGDCRLYDQLGQPDLACGVPALALPVLVPTALALAWREGEVLARRAALFDARAPPAFR